MAVRIPRGSCLCIAVCVSNRSEVRRCRVRCVACVRHGALTLSSGTKPREGQAVGVHSVCVNHASGAADGDPTPGDSIVVLHKTRLKRPPAEVDPGVARVGPNASGCRCMHMPR